jgi:hypothetical protein
MNNPDIIIIKGVHYEWEQIGNDLSLLSHDRGLWFDGAVYALRKEALKLECLQDVPDSQRGAEFEEIVIQDYIRGMVQEYCREHYLEGIKSIH